MIKVTQWVSQFRLVDMCAHKSYRFCYLSKKTHRDHAVKFAKQKKKPFRFDLKQKNKQTNKQMEFVFKLIIIVIQFSLYQRSAEKSDF